MTSCCIILSFCISSIQFSSPPCDRPFTLVGTKLRKASRPARPGKTLKVQFRLTRWKTAVPATAKGKVWENYDLTITLPGAPHATLYGKPRVSPSVRTSKHPAVVSNNRVTWTDVPMLVNPFGKKNYTRKFTVTTKVAKTFVGNLTFDAVATGPAAQHSFELVVPVVASRKN